MTATTMTEQTTGCQCTRHLGPIDTATHDYLLGLEGLGVAGAVELFAYVDRCLDGDDEHGVTWPDLADFVARHNWTDPSAMMELANLAVDHGRARAAAVAL